MINIKLCEMVLHIELYLFSPLSMNLIIFQGHSSVKQFQLKMLCFEPIKFKLCTVIHHVDCIMSIVLMFDSRTFFKGDN